MKVTINFDDSRLEDIILKALNLDIVLGKEYILPKDPNSVYEIQTIDEVETIINQGKYKEAGSPTGIKIFYDPDEEEWVLSMDTPNIRREYGNRLKSSMKVKGYLVTSLGNSFGVIRESPSRGLKFYKLDNKPRDTLFEIKETKDGITIKKGNDNGKIKVKRTINSGIEEDYLLD